MLNLLFSTFLQTIPVSLPQYPTNKRNAIVHTLVRYHLLVSLKQIISFAKQSNKLIVYQTYALVIAKWLATKAKLTGRRCITRSSLGRRLSIWGSRKMEVEYVRHGLWKCISCYSGLTMSKLPAFPISSSPNGHGFWHAVVSLPNGENRNSRTKVQSTASWIPSDCGLFYSKSYALRIIIKSKTKQFLYLHSRFKLWTHSVKEATDWDRRGIRMWISLEKQKMPRFKDSSVSHKFTTAYYVYS